MIYVMSDIHGEYDKYKAMLEKIGFGDDDELFVLGDVVDRGEKSVELLKDMSTRANVYPIMGNHDFMALDLLKKLIVEITEENFDQQINAEIISEVMSWQQNGGEPTMAGFKRLDKEDREALVDYLSEFAYYEIVQIKDKLFILVHSGLGNFSLDKDLDDYDIEELAFLRADYDTKYFENDKIFIVSGHTPTLAITGKAEIYHSHNNICIDCGATFASGKLACLCLDTMEEFYI